VGPTHQMVNLEKRYTTDVLQMYVRVSYLLRIVSFKYRLNTFLVYVEHFYQMAISVLKTIRSGTYKFSIAFFSHFVDIPSKKFNSPPHQNLLAPAMCPPCHIILPH
jgi:hypothetical protein